MTERGRVSFPPWRDLPERRAIVADGHDPDCFNPNKWLLNRTRAKDGSYCHYHVLHYGGHCVLSDCSDADRRRILACVNALGNVSTDFLESVIANGRQLELALQLQTIRLIPRRTEAKED